MKQTTFPDASFRISGLGKRYADGTWGLRHASATFSGGRMTAVLGPNGAGKSTLIHMLAGALQADEGGIHFADEAVRIGWSSQRTTIDWFLNVRQNVELGGRLYGMSRGDCRTRALHLLEQFDLADQAQADVSMLSGGQQQRIQVARTLMSDPDVMLLDEPTAALDVESSEAVLALIKERTRSGASALISSHDLGLLERYCDDVLFILDGRLIAHQPLRSFQRTYAPTDVIHLTFADAPSPEIINSLTPFSPEIVDGCPEKITVELPDGGSLTDVFAVIGSGAHVLEATREVGSLRDVYLRMIDRKDHT